MGDPAPPSSGGVTAMSDAPRKSLWPRRWIRSFAGAALATGLAGGALAQDPPKVPDAPKLDVPKVAEPPKAGGSKEAGKDDKPAPAKEKEKYITFSMSG